jgi:hypothetical protein
MIIFLAIASACVVCVTGAIVLARTLFDWADEIERRQRDDVSGLSLFGEEE